MSRRRVKDFLRLGAIAGVVQQFRPPQVSDFGGGGIDSPIFVNATTGEVFIFVNGQIVPLFGFASVKSFGAKGDNVTNDSVAIQAAVDYASTFGNGLVFFPPGSYVFQNISITAPVMIVGAGGADLQFGSGTRLTPLTTTSTLFVVDCLGSVTFHDFVVGGRGQTAGSAFTVKRTGTSLGVGNLGSTFNNIKFSQCFVGISFENALLYSVTDCGFWDIPAGGYGVSVTNTFNADQGDGNISGNYFAGQGTALLWNRGGGGLRFNNNKTICPTAISVDLSSALATGQLLIQGNSLDGITGVGVNIVETAGVIGFESITIADNFFGCVSNARVINIGGLAAAHITQVVIANNVIRQFSNVFTASAICAEYVDNLTVTGNSIVVSGSTGVGVEVGVNVTQGQVTGNNIQGVATKVLNSSGANTLVMQREAGGWAQLFMDFTNTATIGAVVMNKASGRVNVAAGSTTIVVTNSLVTAGMKVFASPAAVDANSLAVRAVVCGAGSFTVTLTAAPAANLPLDFFLVSV